MHFHVKSYANTYLRGILIGAVIAMAEPNKPKKRISDEEVEEILDMQAPKDIVRELRAAIKEEPLLMAGLIFTLGILVGVSLSPRRRD